MIRASKLEKLISTTEHFPTNLSVGLTKAQVKEREKAGLTNKLVKRVTKSYLRIFYENVVNAWNILLFIIAGLMIFAKIEITNFAFLLVLFINIGVGLYQDIRARKLVDKLKVLDYPEVNVLRDKEITKITSNKIVLSEIVQVKMGNQIPCDGTLMAGTIEVNESMLTGESTNISKNIGDQIYSGSYVTAGTGLYRVEQLGKANYAEKLQSKARKFKKPKSEILSSIHGIFKSIGGAVALLAVALIVFYSLQDKLPLKELDNRVLIFVEGSKQPDLSVPFMRFRETVRSISGALVAMVPIGMYLLTTITLAIGVIRLANKKMLTQDMYCIEMLARADVLCLDKTGTLTDGEMTVKEVIPTTKITEKDLCKILLTLVDATKDENPTATAIRRSFSKYNKFDVIDAIAFNSVKKYSAVMLEDGKNVVLGAREFIPHADTKIDKICQKYEQNGYRVLVIGLSSKKLEPGSQLNDIKIIGILILEDHIRDDAPENIKWFNENGVAIKIITGDNPATAAEIAKRAGVKNSEKYISLEGMSTDEVKLIATDYVVFGRVSPEQKEALIEALKEAGHTVAMTGDGVNDILALRVADCSIAMASGSDAAKNVAHLVSLESNFSSLPDVVKEGRRVINNLQRAISIYLVKTVFAIVLTIYFIVVGLIQWSAKVPGVEIISYPFETKNMYIWEMVNIGIGSLFLSLQPNEEQIKSSFMSNILAKVLPAAFYLIITVIIYYLIALNPGSSVISQIINENNVKDLCVLLFSIGSFVILVRVCMPLDAYRSMLVLGLGFVDMILMFSDYHLFKSVGTERALFGINYEVLSGGFKTKEVWTLIISVVLGIVIYICLEKLSKWIQAKLDARKEAMKL